MSGIIYNNQVLNQRGTPTFFQDVIANRPSAGVTGRIFVSTDTFVIQRDTGTAWQNIGGAFAGSGAVGQVAFFDTTSSVTGDNGLFWNNTTKRLGIGTTSPSVKVDIHATDNLFALNVTSNSGNGAIQTIKGTNRYRWFFSDLNWDGTTTGYPNFGWQLFDGSITFIQFTNTNSTPFVGYTDLNNLRLSGTNKSSYQWGNLNLAAARFFNTAVQIDGLFSISVPTQFTSAGYVFDSSYSNPNHTFFIRALGQQQASFGSSLNFLTSESFGQTQCLNLNKFGIATFATRVNIANATDNANYELQVAGNTYTGGIAPNISTFSTNTQMLRTGCGYYCIANLTLTLPTANGLNNIYYIIAANGVTITLNANAGDDIINLSGVSVTTLTINSNQRAMVYVGGGTRSFLIFQA